MSLYEENGLPGVFTEVVAQLGEDYDTSQFGTGDSVVLIGTAFDGPVGKVVKVYSPAHGKYIFGSSFDSKTRREATLTAGIQDAWDRGCRTIYAVRVGGKEIYKDFQLAKDINFKLRVSGLFPSNSNKQLAVCLEKGNGVDGGGSLKIFKEAKRATIKEKRFGLVEDPSQVLVNEIGFDMNGLTNDDELIELIKVVNSNQFNNVIKLSIVDLDGNDVTLSSKEAKALKISDVFAGVYLIGREANISGKVDTNVILKIDEDGQLVKEIIKNTSVSKEYPLFSKNGDLDKLLGAPSLTEYGFLSVPGRLDEIFMLDKIDYEEVDMDLYEVYEKLGSGFAINAGIVSNEKGISYKVIEIKDKDKRISPIKSGIFSMLEQFEVDYRVLLGFNADDNIKGRLPAPRDFIVSKPKTIKLKEGVIELVPNVDSNDFNVAKGYEICLEKINNSTYMSDYKIDPADVILDKSIREATLIGANGFGALEKQNRFDKVSVKEGSLFLVADGELVEGDGEKLPPAVDGNVSLKLYVYTKGKLQCLHEGVAIGSPVDGDAIYEEIVFAEGKFFIAKKPEAFNGKQTVVFREATIQEILGDSARNQQKTLVSVAMDKDIFNVVEVIEPSGEPVEGTVAYTRGNILGTCDQIFKAEEDLLLTALSTAYTESVICGNPEVTNCNKIIIRTNQEDYITVDEFANMLNNDKDFSKLFTVKIVNETNAQQYVEELFGGSETLKLAPSLDREVGYDTSKLVRFRTTDNFARLLAQHCTYTSLKTGPTHGIIGVSPILNTSIESIEKKVNSLIALQLENTLVAKKDNGQNMLNKDNVPHHIGRNISVVVCQYPVTTTNNYTFISNLAAGYAGMVSRLPIDQSSTCQPIAIPYPQVTFNQYQLTNLTNSGFVTVKESQTQGLVITDGVTMAPPQDVFRRLSCCRVANAIDDILRNACEPFIGRQNSPANQNSLRTAIKSGLDAVKDKLIEGYEFRMDIDSSVKQLGEIQIFYRIVPIYEIKEIKNHITI